MRRRTLHLAMLVLLLNGCGLVSDRDDGGEWVRAERRDLIISVELTGHLVALEAARLGPPSVRDMHSFKIVTMAPEGEEVEAGTPVLAFDTTELEQRLQTAATELDSVQTRHSKQRIDLAIRDADDALRIAEAEAKVRAARLLAGRPPELVPGIEHRKGLLDLAIAEEELSALVREIEASRRSAQAELDGLESDLQRAANLVAEIETSLAAMTVSAPRAGIVIHAADWRGEKKKPGDACWREDRPVEIPDLRRMAADCEVKEAEAGRIAVGQPVRLRLDAHPDVEYRGRVQEVSTIVQRRSFWNPATVVTLRVALDSPDPGRMRPSMRLTGRIEIDRIPKAVVLPIDAVISTERGPMVDRRNLLGSTLTPIGLGRRSRTEVAVVHGLAAGDAVRRRPNGGGSG